MRVRTFHQRYTGLERRKPATRHVVVDKAIKRRLTARWLVVVLSECQGSDWVEKEVRYAQAQRKVIFPLLATGEPSTAVPLQLIDAEFIDIRTDFEARCRACSTRSDATCRWSTSRRRPPCCGFRHRRRVASHEQHGRRCSSTSITSRPLTPCRKTWRNMAGPAGTPQPRRSRAAAFRMPTCSSVASLTNECRGPAVQPQRITVKIYDTWQRFEVWVRASRPRHRFSGASVNRRHAGTARRAFGRGRARALGGRTRLGCCSADRRGGPPLSKGLCLLQPSGRIDRQSAGALLPRAWRQISARRHRPSGGVVVG